MLNQRTFDTPANKNMLCSLHDVTSHFDLESAVYLESTVDLASGVYSTNCLPNWGVDLESTVDLTSGDLEKTFNRLSNVSSCSILNKG